MSRPWRVMRSGRAVGIVAVLAVLAGGCARTVSRPPAAPAGDPIGLRNLQITSVDGHRAVLLRLSRQPTLVRNSSASRPGRIIVQAWGPAGDDLPERKLPELDRQISQVRVSRRNGTLEVAIDFQGDTPPPYTVHEMADWIMIRFAAPAAS